MSLYVQDLTEEEILDIVTMLEEELDSRKEDKLIPVGSCVTLEGWGDDIYMVAQVANPSDGTSFFTLISLNDGNRFNAGAYLKGELNEHGVYCVNIDVLNEMVGFKCTPIDVSFVRKL